MARGAALRCVVSMVVPRGLARVPRRVVVVPMVLRPCMALIAHALEWLAG